jgi:glycosyltransferase involved in cell wall biosynthesis
VSGRYCVIIPAFNAERTIGVVVEAVKQRGLPVIVIDDGSRDRTAAIASERGALVISHLRNYGKGRALRTGFAYALRSSYDGIVTMDGDGQHDAEDILPLIRAGEVQHAGMVVGNRMSNGHAAMPRARWLTNRLMSRLVSFLARHPIPDSQCGLRVIRKELLASLSLSADRFEIETELLLAAAKRRWKTVSVPVRTIYNDHPSPIQPLRDTIRFFGVVLRYLFR